MKIKNNVSPIKHANLIRVGLVGFGKPEKTASSILRLKHPVDIVVFPFAWGID